MKSSCVGIYKLDYTNQKEVFLGHFDEHAFVGRSRNADIIVNDPKIDGIHAFLERKNNKYQLVDLGSYYGTFYKKRRIKDIEIGEQEPFQLGKQVLFIKKIEDREILKRIKLKKPKEIIIETDNSNLNIEDPKKSNAKQANPNKLLEVSLFWGEKTLEVRSFEKNSLITLGTHREATFVVAFGTSEHLNAPYPLARFEEGLLTLDLPVDASGIVWLDNQVYSIDTLRHRDAKSNDFGQIKINLKIGDKAHIHFGELSLCFRFITPAKPIPVNWFSELDSSLLKIVMLILILLLFLFLYIQFTPRPPEPVKTLADIPQNLKRILFDSGMKNAISKERAAIGQMAQNMEGGRESGEEGRSAGSATQNNLNNKKIQTASLPQKEKTIGLNKNKGQISNQKSKLDIDSVFATNTKSGELNYKAVPTQNSGQAGSAVSKLVGESFGKGIKGTGSGGGGSSVGIGALKGNATGGGMGHGNSGFIPTRGLEINSNSPGDGGNDFVIIGGLDSDIISAIIKRYLPQIQNCYEQQLVISPALQGKVTVAFTIGPDGSVKNPTISESSLRNQPTERCMLDKIQDWKFPKPRGGGTVGVKYPFLLMSNRAR
jgi:TonB family protein